MSNDFTIERDAWLDSSADDTEARALTRLRVSVAGELITRNVSKRGGGESEAITTSLLPLAQFLADNWWPLLYEPLRRDITTSFRVRHRLDSGMRSYAFPSIALWSAGSEAIMADWASFFNPYSPISFITPRPDEPVQLERSATEDALLDFVETVIDRVGASSDSGRQLSEAWDRVRQSISYEDELAYCMTAGRFGFDPYDPEAPDLINSASGLSVSLFGDIAEVLTVEDLPEAAPWLREKEVRLKLFPETDLSFFCDPLVDNLNDPAWVVGRDSAEFLRSYLGIATVNPRIAINDLLGSAIAEGGEVAKDGPEGVSGLVQRLESSARIGTVARSARQRRFRACAATYIAWTASSGEERATTEAVTRQQQASRAFAAEMLAPRQELLARASRVGFDGDDLYDLAGEFICPYETVMWQAVRAGIPLRGIEIPREFRARVVTSHASSLR